MRMMAEQFHISGRPMECRPQDGGRIHVSFRLNTDAGRSYLLQKINRRVFADVDGLMENIAAVTAHLRRKGQKTLAIVPARDGRLYYEDAESCAWRMYEFVEAGHCPEASAGPAEIFACGQAYGAFLEAMSDFPAESLSVTIPDFHNTPRRYRVFRAALAADPLGRAAGVREESEFLLRREKAAGQLQEALEAGLLPLRVCHGDTKINNVMLRAETREPLCVLDLDTVMPGLAAWDFGDGVRSGASEETAVGRRLNIESFEAFARGFLGACPCLTAAERESLVPGVKTMTLELALRYLTDYLLGSPYFGEKSPAQNLEKARGQMGLLLDMEEKSAAMEALLRQMFAGGEGSLHP